jgi:Protein of unknown function (DUF4079)
MNFELPRLPPMRLLVAALLLFCAQQCTSFCVRTGSPAHLRTGKHVSATAQLYRQPRSVASITVLAMSSGPLDGLISLVKAREACPPQVCIEQLLLDNVRRADLPEAVIHWSHPVTIVALALPLALGGAYLGWQIRLDSNSSSGSSSGSSGAARRLHAPLMAGALLLFVFGVQGGIASLLLQNHSLLDSPHAATAGVLLALFSLQGLMGVNMGSNATARTAHAAVGTVAIAALLGHAALGLQLGLSLP